MHRSSQSDLSEKLKKFEKIYQRPQTNENYNPLFQRSSHSNISENRPNHYLAQSNQSEILKRSRDTQSLDFRSKTPIGFDSSLYKSSQPFHERLNSETLLNQHDKIYQLENALAHKETIILELKLQKNAMAEEIEVLLARIKEKEFQKDAEIKRYLSKIEEISYQSKENEDFIKALQTELETYRKSSEKHKDLPRFNDYDLFQENASLKSTVDSLLKHIKHLESEQKPSTPESFTSRTEFALFKLHEKIKQLQEENDNLTLSLNSRPTFKDLKDKDLIISELKLAAKGLTKRSRSSSQNREKIRENIRKDKELFTLNNGETPSLATMNVIFTDVLRLLKLNNFNEIVPAVKGLKKKGASSDLEVKIGRLVKDLSPQGSFHPFPSGQEIWKWVRRVAEEYLTLKKDLEKEEKNKAIVSRLLGALGIADSSEIIREVNVLIGESHANHAIREKIDLVLDQDPRALLKDFKYLVAEIL